MQLHWGNAFISCDVGLTNFIPQDLQLGHFTQWNLDFGYLIQWDLASFLCDNMA
jgi:hypothetical protein